MKGARPLTETEIEKINQAFDGRYEVRNRCMFIIGIKTGMRISELLSLNVGDVWEKGRPVDILNLRKQQVKGKKEARSIPLNTAAKEAIQEQVNWLSGKFEWGRRRRQTHRTHATPPDWNTELTVERAVALPRLEDTPLFPSQIGDGRLSRFQAHRILKQAYYDAGLTGKVTTHSLRKSFGTKIYTVSKDIMVTKELLGHANVNTTQKYIGVGMDALRAAVDAI
jgi:site-specific recombinase XerD